MIVALEEGVDGLRVHLEEEGYQVVKMNQNVTNADAYILTGLDENITGNATRVSKGFVINAKGRQPEEILYDLKKHFNLLH